MVSPCARFSNFWASSFMDNLVSVSNSSFEISLSILQPHRALSTGSPAWQRHQVTQTKRWIFKIPFFITFIFLTTHFLVSSKPVYLNRSALSFIMQKKETDFYHFPEKQGHFAPVLQDSPNEEWSPGKEAALFTIQAVTAKQLTGILRWTKRTE